MWATTSAIVAAEAAIQPSCSNSVAVTGWAGPRSPRRLPRNTVEVATGRVAGIDLPPLGASSVKLSTSSHVPPGYGAVAAVS
jgi:hypothetical protein